ncbi:hypothetical protein BN1723_001704 [Verticillium longisporum]|uniref:W2 domain-containing protein n=1 Tax=Verticillium longisporum TaxID=100787 RepID=A0A0G4KJX6_VERLO|nr:hypothetical protein BN1723_001704 [Verticillium longisporum]
MAGECLDHMAAGIDTTGDGLCFLMWQLSQPSSMHCQEKLQQELRNNPDVDFDKLPYLDAVIQEGLRCFPPIPMSLPRRVPQGGKVVDGFFVPGGTIVSCQAYSVHTINSQVFPEPEVFDPERWTAAEGDVERKRLMFAFANGGRGCVGKHLALAEMKILLKDVYSRYTTLPDPSMTAESMEMSDQLVSSRPVGQKCLLRFTEEKGSVDKVDSIEIFVKAKELGIEGKHRAVLVLVQTIFDENVLAQITKRAPMLKQFVTSERHEKALLGGTERLIGSLIGEHPDILEKVVKILQLYYNHDLLSEDVAVKWGSKASKKYVDLATSKKVRKAAEPFLTWLQEASEEEDSDDE